MRRTCARCGSWADAPDGGMPDGWSVDAGRRGAEFHCDRCTRDNIRAIEGKLPEEWWEA